MKLLFDQNISFRIVKKILDFFPSAKSVKELGLMNKNDREIWNYAKTNDFAVITFDKDFYNLNLIYGSPPKIIWFRTGNVNNDRFIEVLNTHKEKIEMFLEDKMTSPNGCLEVFVF